MKKSIVAMLMARISVFCIPVGAVVVDAPEGIAIIYADSLPLKQIRLFNPIWMRPGRLRAYGLFELEQNLSNARSSNEYVQKRFGSGSGSGHGRIDRGSCPGGEGL